jgi:hypothetical protein
VPTRNPEPIRISHLGDLNTLRVNPFVPRRALLDIPSISPSARCYWEAIINRCLDACGCREGQLLAMIALATYVPAALFARGRDGLSMLLVTMVGLAVVIAAMLAGKLLGLLLAQYRLRKVVKSILLSIPQS